MHDMEMLSALLAIAEENPLVTDGFLAQRASNVEIWCFHLCYPKKPVDKQAPVLWSALKVMWRHYDDVNHD